MVDVEKEDRLFRLLDEAVDEGEYTRPFRYMQEEGIDPVNGVCGYVEQGLEVATTALEAETGSPENLPLLETEKRGGLFRLQRAEKVADDMAWKGLIEDESLQELREEIQDVRQTYDYLTEL
jgi:hypothetical protein